MPYVGLVASRKRGAAVIDELRADGVAEELLQRIETPAGIDIGARTPAEIALSILARIVEVRRSRDAEHARDAAAAPVTAVDPICGMTVVVGADTPSSEHDGETVYFCCEGCKRTFEAGGMRATGDPRSEVAHLVPDVETLAQRLAAVDYLVDEGLATSIFLSLRLPQPLLLEGEAGVGKTEAAKALAAVLDTPLIRLQCYEGIDAAEALYEWNYPRQLLSDPARRGERRRELAEQDLFGPDYLIRRPLLRALEHPGPRPAVLLIDEIDRADDDFEAFLLELLGEAAVTIPELGAVRATHPPIIVLTSNRTRDLHDAVKRRCLYQWIEYPSREREVEIIRRRVKGASETLAVQVADAVARMRDSDVQKPPGVAEAIDWVAALELLGVRAARRRRDRPHARVGAEVLRGPGGGPRRRPRAARGSGRMTAFGVREARARPAGARRRVRPAAARGRRARHGRALGAVRARAEARAAGQPAAPVLDGARGVRLGPDAAAGVRRRVRGGVRPRPRPAAGDPARAYSGPPPPTTVPRVPIARSAGARANGRLEPSSGPHGRNL